MQLPDWLIEHHTRVTGHFDDLAPDYPRYKGLNPYYHETLERWCQSRVPFGRQVIDIGCGRGELLRAVAPTRGVGVDLSSRMIQAAAADHPDLDFRCGAIETLDLDGAFDVALCVNTLEYVGDLGGVLERTFQLLRDNGRIVIATANPIWSSIFRTASTLGLRIPDCPRLFITNKDLVNLLALYGFEVVDERMDLILPKKIPGVSDLVNRCVSMTPVVNWLSSTQLIVARKVPVNRKDFSVSVVIPCHNERGNIDRCVTDISRFGPRTELIIVDDGSTDGTAGAVRPELNPAIEVKVIQYSPNEGKGRAVGRGFEAATGDIIMILDADLTTHPEDLAILYEAFVTGRAEFINCTRMVYPMENQAMKILNYIGNKFFTILVSLIMEKRVSDTLCGTKAMFREDYHYMEMGRDPWGDYDFLFGAAQMRLAIREVPIHYRERIAGDSKMKAFKHTMNLLRMCWHGLFQVKTYRPLVKIRRSASEQGGLPRES